MKLLLKALLFVGLSIGSSANATSLTAPSAAGSFSPATTSKNDLENTQPVFLPVQQAFKVEAVLDKQRLNLLWTIADGYYLYRKSLKVNALSPSVQIDTPVFAEGTLKWDEYFEADVVVYYDQTSFEVPFSSDKAQFQLQLESQGCADAGLCYPPRKQIITIDLTAGTAVVREQTTKPLGSVPADKSTSTPLWLILLFALAGGLILNLMPCVFPVLSIKVLSFNPATSNQQ